MEIKNSIKCDSSTSNQNCNGSNQGADLFIVCAKISKKQTSLTHGFLENFVDVPS